MSFDPASFFTGLAAVVFLASGFDLGIAFLMRGEREAIE